MQKLLVFGGSSRRPACGTHFLGLADSVRKAERPFSPRGMPQHERVVAARPEWDHDRIPPAVKLNFIFTRSFSLTHRRMFFTWILFYFFRPIISRCGWRS
jgi:hypothetical protein